MELWRVRKAYRQLAVRLRRSPIAMTDVEQQAEIAVVQMLSEGDRIETELAVLRHTRRSARARLRRLRERLEGMGVLKTRPPSLVRRPDELAAQELHGTLLDGGWHDLASIVVHVQREVLHLDRRIDDTRTRLQRLNDTARALFDHLVRFADSLRGQLVH